MNILNFFGPLFWIYFTSFAIVQILVILAIKYKMWSNAIGVTSAQDVVIVRSLGIIPVVNCLLVIVLVCCCLGVGFGYLLHYGITGKNNLHEKD